MTTTVRTTSPPGVPRRRPSTHTAKVVMAATGLVLGAFVLVHLVGNLKVWSGAASLDEYARWLRTVGEPLVPHEGVLWALRLVLSVCLVAHLWCAAVLCEGVGSPAAGTGHLSGGAASGRGRCR